MRAPKLPIPKHLVQDEKQAAEDGKRLDALCEIAIQAIGPVLQDILQRRTTSEVARSAFAEATSVIAQFFAEEQKRGEVSAIPDVEALSSIRADLAFSIKEIGPEIIAERASEIGRALMSTWVDIVAARAVDAPVQILEDDLLPFDLPQRDLEDLRESIHPLGLDPADTAQILRAVKGALEQVLPFPLPLDIHLTRSRNGAVAVTKEDPFTLETVIDRLHRLYQESVRDVFPELSTASMETSLIRTQREASGDWLYSRDIERSLGMLRGVGAVQVFAGSKEARLAIAYRITGSGVALMDIENALAARVRELGFRAEPVAVTELPRETFEQAARAIFDELGVANFKDTLS